MAKKKKVRKKRSKKSDSVKMRIVFKNLISFLILSILSFALYLVSTSEFYISLFGFAWVIFGFITLAFFMSFLILKLRK